MANLWESLAIYICPQGVRARTYKRHIAAQHIEYLWQLIKTIPA